MKTTTYKIGGLPISYEVAYNGYSIYLGGKLWITQFEPYIPYRDLSYEESCLKQIEELAKTPEKTVSVEERVSALEETIDDILTNVIPSMTEESGVN